MREPVGVILAGGLGRRIGGSKATVQLAGRPLISYPLATLRDVLSRVAVLAKADTELPSMPGVTVWIEPDREHHPLVGIVRGLGLAEGRSVLVCAVDLPFVSSVTVRRLASGLGGGALASVATYGGDLQPLLGCYAAGAAPLLFEALAAGAPAREAAAALDPVLVEIGDERELFNVNAPEDVLTAVTMLRGNQPNVKS